MLNSLIFGVSFILSAWCMSYIGWRIRKYFEESGLIEESEMFTYKEELALGRYIIIFISVCVCIGFIVLSFILPDLTEYDRGMIFICGSIFGGFVGFLLHWPFGKFIHSNK